MTAFTPAPAAPVRGGPNFRDQADAMAEWWTVITPQMQAFADSVDPLVTMTPSMISAMNFKGAWPSLSGALSIPASVYHNGVQWMLLQNLANVASVAPGTNSAYWVPTGNRFALLQTDTITSAVVQVTGPDLSAYNEAIIILKGVRASSSGFVGFQTSADGTNYANGSAGGAMALPTSGGLTASLGFPGIRMDFGSVDIGPPGIFGGANGYNIGYGSTGGVKRIRIRDAGAANLTAGSIEWWVR